MAVSPSYSVIARIGAASVAAALLLGLTLLTAQARADNPAGANIRSVLLFPIANDSGATADQIGPMIDDAVRLRLATVNKFKVSRFSRLIPSVQQGLVDKDLTEADVQTPFGDDDKDQPRAAKIAERVGVDAYFVGNLDAYTADPATKVVTLQLTGNVYLTEGGMSAKSVGASVTAKPIDASDQLDTVIQEAVNDIASQIASGINGIPLAGPSVENNGAAERSHSIGPEGLLIALLGGALIYAAFHHDSNNSSSPGSSSGTAGSGPPNPPTINAGVR